MRAGCGLGYGYLGLHVAQGDRRRNESQDAIAARRNSSPGPWESFFGWPGKVEG